MEARAIHGYIALGRTTRFLQDCKTGWKIHGSGWVIANIDRLLRTLDELNLAVSVRAARDLKRLRKELAQKPVDAGLKRAEADELREAIRIFNSTLSAESRGKFAFIVTDKRMDVEKLLHDVRSLVSFEVFDQLPEITREDLSEAGKCIAFERPTAAAFHLLRGTEAELRDFYAKLVKRNRIKEPRLWHAIVQALKERSKPPPATLLANLDNIRNSYRNPTSHPELRYTMDEVQNLWGLCVDVMHQMVRYLEQTEKRGMSQSPAGSSVRGPTPGKAARKPARRKTTARKPARRKTTARKPARRKSTRRR